MMLVDEFSGLLKRKMGLDSRSIGAAAVERAVRHRMSATGVDDERDYLMRVQASPAEMQLLIESVVARDLVLPLSGVAAGDGAAGLRAAVRRRRGRRACCAC